MAGVTQYSVRGAYHKRIVILDFKNSEFHKRIVILDIKNSEFHIISKWLDFPCTL